MICKGLNDPSGARGPNVNWLWYDEAGNDRDGLAWQVAIASVRKGKDPQAWITTTPKGKLHWIYDFFIKEEAEELLSEYRDVSDRPLIETFFTTIDENLENLDPGFVISLKKAYVPGSYLYRQEVKGEFVTEGGALGDAAWFTGKILPNPPEKIIKRVRYWDLAASEKKISGKKKTDPDFTSGTKLSMFDDLADDRSFCIEDQVAGQLEWEGIKSLILTTAIKDGVYVPIYVEQEPGAGGKNQIAELKSFIQKKLDISYQVIGHLPEGDKIMRANPWFAEAAQGYFYMVIGKWNTPFLEQLGSFPQTKHDDLVDGVSGARAVIAPFRSFKKIRFLHLGGNLDDKKDKQDNESSV
jgi:predicted phage terminase large subunit-like protein